MFDDERPDDSLTILANDPASIQDVETCQAVLDALDRACAAIDASLDTARMRAQAEGLDAVDEDWYHRASNARHHLEYKQRRVAKRLKKLERQNSPAPAIPPQQSAGKIELAKTRQQTHLESMRLALEAKERRGAMLRERERERERRFVDTARRMLPKDTYAQIWREVEAELADAPKSATEAN